MQTISSQFNEYAIGQVRPIAWGVRASFNKIFDDNITFFTLDTSILDGTDVLGPTDESVIQVWDKYEYIDYSSRALSLEVTREETEPYSITQAFADVTVNNYDNYFTPNSGSPIENYILPRRPFRLLMGFGIESLPQIVGLSEGMPTLNKSSRAASFHIIDFMSYILDQDISETIILEDVETAEVLDYLFQVMGLTDDQYILDDSLNTIKFFYVEKGTKFKTVADKLMEAEIGRLYMDEAGIIRFKNRYSVNLVPVYTFDKSNVLDYAVNDEAKIINSVKITSQVREVQVTQPIWSSASPSLINVGDSLVLWAEFLDPVTTAVDPAYSADEDTTSYFTSHLNEDGTGAYTDVSLTSMELFSKSAKLTFNNAGASTAYLTAIEIYGTPAKVVDTIKVEEIDQDSIDKYEEQLYEIDNEYIQDESNAQSRALILLHDYAEYGTGIDIDVKGNSALQLGDAVDVDLDGFQGIHVITKTVNIITDGQFGQRLRLRQKQTPTFFTLDTSILDGSDLLSP